MVIWKGRIEIDSKGPVNRMEEGIISGIYL